MTLQGWRLDCGWVPCIPTIIGLHYDRKAEAEMAASMTHATIIARLTMSGGEDPSENRPAVALLI